MSPVRVACATLCLVVACKGGGSSGGNSGGGAGEIAVELVEAFAGLTLTRPVKLVQHPDDDDRWHALEQEGRLRTFLASDPAGTLATAGYVGAAVDLGDTSL